MERSGNASLLTSRVLWLHWVVINFACLENILLPLLISEGNPWSNVWACLVRYYFYWYMKWTTDQKVSASFLCIPKQCSKEPGEQVATFPKISDSNVNSFCQQIKSGLLDVLQAPSPSIPLTSITLSAAVLLPCHFLFWLWEAPALELNTRRFVFLVRV